MKTISAFLNKREARPRKEIEIEAMCINLTITNMEPEEAILEINTVGKTKLISLNKTRINAIMYCKTDEECIDKARKLIQNGWKWRE
jgi:hypothetical protein